MKYRVKLEPDDDTILVTSPDIPEVVTYGEDEEDAKLRAVDAIETILDYFMREQMDIPAPAAKATKGTVLVQLPTQVALKVELYRTMRARGMTKARLSRELGVARPQVDRMLNLKNASRLDLFDVAFDKMGASVDVKVELRRQ